MPPRCTVAPWRHCHEGFALRQTVQKKKDRKSRRHGNSCDPLLALDLDGARPFGGGLPGEE